MLYMHSLQQNRCTTIDLSLDPDPKTHPAHFTQKKPHQNLDFMPILTTDTLCKFRGEEEEHYEQGE